MSDLDTSRLPDLPLPLPLPQGVVSSLRPHPRRRAPLTRLFLITTVLGVLGLLISPAFAADSTNYGIRPAEAADHFRMELAPGAASAHTAIVSNRSDKTVTFKVYPADALTTEQGGFALRGREEPQAGVGRWTALPFDTITIGAGSQKPVPFRVTVPTATPPGDYAGGVILEAPPREGTPGEVADQTAVQLNVVERVGVRVYLKVSGTARPALSTGMLDSTDDNDVITFTLPLTNTGNVILRPAATAVVRGRVGGTTELTFAQVESLLPGQTTTLRATWADPPDLVWGHAEAEVQHDGGVARAQADVRRVPWAQAAIVAVTSLLVLGIGAWAVRTVGMARRVLRQSGHPGPDVAQPSAANAMFMLPAQADGAQRGRHRR